MVMPGRKYPAAGGLYRYGFNGKEKDDEVVQYDYGFRIYDPRIVRFKSIDPLTKSYPWYTPYQFAGNMPIAAIDLDGLESKVVINTTSVDGTVLHLASENYIIQNSHLGVKFISDNSGPLGHGTYTVTYSSDGKSFKEDWIPDEGNSTNPFSIDGVSTERWGKYELNKTLTKVFEDRLNGRVIEKAAEDALVTKGFDEGQVQKDVSVLETDNVAFKGKFATFTDDATADNYTKNWETEDASKPHKSSNKAKVSGELNKSGVQVKVYDGATSRTDDVPNHIGFTKTSVVAHVIEAIKASVSSSTNIDRDNAETYKKSIEKPSSN
jgi:RHS repeat-associated protein